MGKPIRFLSKADEDLDLNYLYISADNQQAALRFLDEFENSTLQISEFPTIGSTRFAHLSLVKTIRVFPISGFARYLIFYVERDNYIDVIRILHSSMDISTELLWD